MPHPHNHEEWLCKRGAGKQGSRNGGHKKARRGQFERQPEKGPEKPPTKLALSEKLKTTLVTQFSMTPDDADNIFEKCYGAAQEEDSSKD